MKQYVALMISIALITSLFFSCEKEKPLPSGYEKIVGNSEGEILDTVLTQQPGTEQFYSKYVDTGNSTQLLLGGYGAYRSGFFLKFKHLPDTVVINSAELILYVREKIAPFDSSFWEVNQQAQANVFLADIADTLWYDNNLPIESADLQIGTYTINSDSTSEITIPLDSSKVNEWITEDSVIKDYEVWISSYDTEFMQIYYSYEIGDATLMPRLNLAYTILGDTTTTQDTTIYYASEDGFVLLNDETDLNLNTDLLYIGKGLAFRSLLKFNFDMFDTTTHVNRALLKLTTNNEFSIRNKSGASECLVYRLAEEWIDEGLSEEMTTISYAPTYQDSTLTFDITPSVQGWTNGNYENYGLLVKSQNEGTTIGRVALYSSQSDSLVQPKLHIYYTTPFDKEF